MIEKVAKYVEREGGRTRHVLLFFIIYPFGAFLYSLRDLGRTKLGFFPLIFFVLYGYTFIPIENSDGSRYKLIFENYSTVTFDDYLTEIKNTYSGQSRNPDIYAPTILYLVSRFTSNAQIFFAALALVYFLVFRELFNLVVRFCPEKFGLHFFYFLGAFFIYNLSAGINGIRFPLAFLIFSYGALSLVIEQKPKHFLIALLSGLVHFAFWLPCLFLLLFLTLPKNRFMLVYYVLILAALLASTFFSELIYDNVTLFGEGVETKFSGYTREGYIQEREAHKQIWNWYVLFNMYSTYYFLIAALFLSRFSVFRIKVPPMVNRLFVFVLILFVQAILTGNVVDSISNRYILLFKFFGLIYIMCVQINNPTNMFLRTVTYIYIPLVILSVLVSLRGDYFTLSPALVLGNIFFILLFKSDVPLAELL